MNNYDKWLIILSAVKHSDYNNTLYNIFNGWSKNFLKYNTDKNMSIYNSNKSMIDINYINFLLKEKHIKLYTNIKMLNGHKFTSM